MGMEHIKFYKRHAWWCEMLHWLEVLGVHLNPVDYGFYGKYCNRCKRYYDITKD